MADEFSGVSVGALTPIRPHHRSPSPMVLRRDIDEAGYRGPSPSSTTVDGDDDGGGGGDGGGGDGGPEAHAVMTINPSDLSSVLSSPRVSVLATSLFQELSVLVENYGEPSVTGVIPIMVNMLESLDGSMHDLKQTQSVLEEITEDNDQLHAQFERERKLRRDEQQLRLAAEDAVESERRDAGEELEMLRQNNRRVQKQLLAAKDQVKRSDDRLVQLKSEQTELKNKYTRVNHALQLAMRRDKRAVSRRTSQLGESPVPSLSSETGDDIVMQSLPSGSVGRRVSLPQMSTTNAAGNGQDVAGGRYMTAMAMLQATGHVQGDAQRNEAAVPEEIASAHAVGSRVVAARTGVHRPMATSSPLKIGQQDRAQPLPLAQDDDGSMLESIKMETRQMPMGVLHEEVNQDADLSEPATPTAARQLPTAGSPAPALGILGSEVSSASEPVDTTPTGVTSGRVHFSQPGKSTGEEEDDEPTGVFGLGSSGYDSPAGSVEVAAMLHDEDDELEYDRLLQAQLRGADMETNDQSFSQELSGQFITEEGSLLDIDPGADITVMDSENLVNQIHDLDKKRNELESVINERDARILELASEQEDLQQRSDAFEKQRTELHQKIAGLEEGLREKELMLEEATQNKEGSDEPLFPGADEDWRVNREKGRRFTRVEMGRVVKERNDYKEKYFSMKDELEMLRNQLEKPQPSPKKEKTSLWKLFASLFTKKSPSPDKRNPLDADFVQLEAAMAKEGEEGGGDEVLESSQPLTFDESRFEAYGWSLPSAMKPLTTPLDAPDHHGSFSEEVKSELGTVPVLTHSSPMVQQEELEQYVTTSSKVFSAAAVCCTPQSNPSMAPSDLVCPSSLVWLCVGTTELSRVDVVDTNSPKEVLHSFPVGTSPILAIACVPGVESSGGGDVHIADSGVESKSLTRAEIDKWRLNSSPAHSPAHLAVKSAEGDQMSVHSGHFASNSNSDRDPTSPSRSRVTSPDSEPSPSRASAAVGSQDETDRGIVLVDGKLPEDHVPSEIRNRPKLMQPTMWLGAEFGALYVHSAVNSWQSCLHAMKVAASILSITYTRHKVFVSMENGAMMVFHRDAEQVWDFDNFDVIDISTFVTTEWKGRLPATTVLAVDENVWCGVGNSVVVINSDTHEMVKMFVVHPSSRGIVQRLVRCDDGVWICVRRDSTLRLFNAITMEHLQDLDVSGPMQALLTHPGSRRKPSPHNLVRISSLLISNDCLWIGANNGAIICIPCSSQRPRLAGQDAPVVVVESNEDGSVTKVIVPAGDDPLTSDGNESDGRRISTAVGERAILYDEKYRIPYCDLESARFSFHGHLQYVDVLVAAPGVMATRTRSASNVGKEVSSSITYVLSAGSGYVDFRLRSSMSNANKSQAERNNIIIWQVSQQDGRS